MYLEELLMKTIKDLKQLKTEQFYGLLFDARTMTHKMHLETKSYSTHKALNDFYSEIEDLADEYIECFQGQYGILDLEETSIDENDPISYISEFVDKTKKYQETVKDSHLKNIIDEIISLCYKTLYKLKHLK